MEYTIRKAKERDCYVLSKIMREVDKQEIWSSGRHTPLSALLEGYKVSGKHCYTLLLNKNIVGIFGVSEVEKDKGVVWLMGADEMTKYKKDFYKLSKKYLKKFLREFKVLFNYIDERNKTTIKWLEKLGFSFISREPEFGEDKIPFDLFIKERNYV